MVQLTQRNPIMQRDEQDDEELASQKNRKDKFHARALLRSRL
jgi:hypothetical protein